MSTFRSEATAYGDGIPGYPLRDVPAGCWRKIELAYSDGDVLVFAFARKGPGTEANYRETMLRLQMGLPGDVRVVVTDADGTTTEAETWGGAA